MVCLLFLVFCIRDGYNFDGERIRVEMASSRGRGDRDRGGYRDYGRGGRDYGRGGGGGGGGRRTEYRLIVSGLPQTARSAKINELLINAIDNLKGALTCFMGVFVGIGSWQDLKDHMRRAGDVCYANVDHRSHEGTVEFTTKDDMFRAIRKLDKSEFRNPFDTKTIRVRLPRDSRFRSSSR